MKFLICFKIISLLIPCSIIGYDFQADSPLPTSIMSRFANRSKPRLVIPHVTEYAGYYTLVIPLGIQMAIEGLANFTPYLNRFELEVQLLESNCEDPVMISQSMALFECKKYPTTLPLHLGGGCPPIGQKLVGEIAHFYNFTAISAVDVVAESFHQRKRFRNFFTLAESTPEIHETLLDFIESQGWRRVAILGEDHLFYTNVS